MKDSTPETLISTAARILGARGGRSTSPKKVKAVQKNGKRGGRPAGSKNKPKL
jgi:hypothetical protein